MASKVLTLRSSDSETFEVEAEIATAMKFATIKNMLGDGCAGSEIPIPNVDGKTLAMVLEWFRKHADQEAKEDDMKKWKEKLMDVNTDVLYDLLMASNFLDVKDLLETCCQKTVDLIKGKPEQIRNLFGIKNDFTPEEQERLDKDFGFVNKTLFA